MEAYEKFNKVIELTSYEGIYNQLINWLDIDDLKEFTQDFIKNHDLEYLFNEDYDEYSVEVTDENVCEVLDVLIDFGSYDDILDEFEQWASSDVLEEFSNDMIGAFKLENKF